MYPIILYIFKRKLLITFNKNKLITLQNQMYSYERFISKKYNNIFHE